MILMDGKIPYRRIAVGYLIIGLVIPISPLQQTWPHLWMVYPIRFSIAMLGQMWWAHSQELQELRTVQEEHFPNPYEESFRLGSGGSPGSGTAGVSSIEKLWYCNLWWIPWKMTY